MGKNLFYEVEISSRFADFWRYNIAVTCGCFDASGSRTGFVAAEQTVAPVGNGLTEKPADAPSPHTCTFRAEDCHHLLMYVYLIPHSLPTAERIGECKPFELSVKVSYDGKVILHEKPMINQWSGASLEITATRPQD